MPLLCVRYMCALVQRPQSIRLRIQFMMEKTSTHPMPTRAALSTLSYIIDMILYGLYIVSIIWCVQQSTWWWKEVHPPPCPPMPTILGPPPLHPPRPSVGQAGSLSQSLVGPASWAAQVAQVPSFPHSPPLLFEQPVDIERVSFVRKPFTPKIWDYWY